MKQRVLKMLGEVSQVIASIPEITHLGNPVLRTKCDPVSQKEGIEVVKKLIEILDKYKKLTGVGGGLAASQIGLNKSVFVTIGKEGYEGYINPKIISSSSQTNFYRESCLSSRMFWGDIERPESITLSWTDEKGLPHTTEFSGFKARLLQHEYDHLLGICCVDKAIPGTLEYSGDVKEEKLRNQPIARI